VADHRAQFDFEIDFSNGGGIQGQGFRLDIAGDDVSDAELADAIVRDLRLLMVREVRIANKRILEERHKRAAARAAAPLSGRGALVDLSHVVEDGMITYPGLPGPVVCDHLSREASRDHYAPGTEFQIGQITMGTFPVRAYASVEVTAG
jgi:arylformamidase